MSFIGRMSMRFLLASAVLLWLSAAAAAAAAAEGETVQVQLQQGAIEGSRSEALGGRPFYSFKTIPYAEPPVGKLRFEDPVAAGAWEGVRNGSLPPPACPQPLPTAETQKEDCLYLNVFTPRPFKSNLPVMVWFLPGAFIYGSMGLYRPEYLLRNDVILVVVQARLGILGFLSTEDSELPGNLGLKDQTLALQWVQSNIHDLGGDPDKVTIFGQNSGSVSVHYHILSPMSKGLFKRAIMQSGSALCSWAIREDHRMMANHIGRWLGCPVMNSTELVNCLKKVPVEQLIAVLNNLPSPYIMVPRIDGEFLPAHPATLVREGRYNRVDIISGKTRDEGSLLVRTFLQDGMMAHMTENSTVLPYVMGFNSWDDNIIFLGRLVYYKYMGPVDFDLSKVDDMVKLGFTDFEFVLFVHEAWNGPALLEWTHKGLMTKTRQRKMARETQLLGDSLFNICSLDATENHARDGAFGNRVFAYELQHRGQFTFTDLYMGPSPDWILPYIGHLDDLQYLFDFGKLNISLSKPEDFFVSRIMVDLWTNFAATGNPTPDMSLGFKWEPAEPSNISYLGITSSPSMKVYSDDQNVEFWRNLPKKMNKLLYPDRFRTN